MPPVEVPAFATLAWSSRLSRSRGSLSTGRSSIQTLSTKAAALCFSLIRGHGFIDGNKRVAHAALEVFLVLNGHEITATVDDQEQLFLALAAGTVTRDQLVAWLEVHADRVKT